MPALSTTASRPPYEVARSGRERGCVLGVADVAGDDDGGRQLRGDRLERLGGGGRRARRA